MSDNVHLVVKSENLSVIAKKYGVTLGKLIELNPVLRKNPNIIFPGMAIRVSKKSDNVHLVVKGENLSVIAKKYGVTLGKLIELNPVLKKNPNIIFPGMAIRVSKKMDAIEARISKMLFNGKKLSIYSINNDRILAEYPAISGLPPNAPHLKELIEKGRKDLKIDTDYTEPKYQNVKDVGPIQEDNYTAIPDWSQNALK